MSKDDLVEFRFSEEEERTQVEWEHAKEFEYRGEMYDVVSVEVKGDTSYYWCWKDHKETKLNEQLNQLVASALEHNPRGREDESRLLAFFDSLYFIAPAEQTTFEIQETRKRYFFVQIVYQFVFRSPPVSPPEIA